MTSCDCCGHLFDDENPLGSSMFQYDERFGKIEVNICEECCSLSEDLIELINICFAEKLLAKKNI